MFGVLQLSNREKGWAGDDGIFRATNAYICRMLWEITSIVGVGLATVFHLLQQQQQDVFYLQSIIIQRNLSDILGG